MYIDEFNIIIEEIIVNNNFLKLKYFRHHRESIYDHSLKVSYLTYKISKKLKLDYKSATRAALLHDFFLYDWRKEGRREKKKLLKKHGFTHPKTALMNSKKNFLVNKKEADIILKHMFPLTLIPPNSIEGWIVMVVDKYITIKEFLQKNPDI
ncbi:HD domain-containing protein [Clostridiaceae bacterium HSG29]|nr:HD domain-containing protein [Clostridiaceae bacterium HSG29]